jgi:hypothetical protein
LILGVGLDLLGLGALADVMPGLTTVEATAITDVARSCIRLWSLLLSISELEVPEGLPCDGFIVQRPVEDWWDGFGTFFFTKQNFLFVPLPGVKPDGLFLSLWAFFMASSWEIALFTSSWKFSGSNRFNRSYNLPSCPSQNLSIFFASESM